MNMQESESYPSEQVPKSAAHDNVSTPQLMVTDTLAHAAALARKGDLLQAENLIISLSDSGKSRIEAIDLLAKVYAQQGKTDQAQALWLKALQRDPSNIHYLSALRLCAYYKKSRFEHFILQHLWLLISVILWFIVAMIVIVGMTI